MPFFTSKRCIYAALHGEFLVNYLEEQIIK